MNSCTQAIVEQAVSGSNDGRLHFGQVVAMLNSVGVESYAADYRAARTTFYLPDGDSLTVQLGQPEAPIGAEFDAAAIKAAIGAAQRGSIMYPEFKRLTRAAGCVGYVVWLAGRHVSYFGRKGESHVEQFPN